MQEGRVAEWLRIATSTTQSLVLYMIPYRMAYRIEIISYLSSRQYNRLGTTGGRMYHFLHVHHFGANDDEVGEGPGVSGDGELGIGGDIPHGAAEDDEKRSERPSRGKRLIPEQSVGDGNEEGGSRPKYDESVNISMLEEIRISEDGKVEDESRGEESASSSPDEFIMRDHACTSCYHHADHGRQVLKRGQKRRVGEVSHRVFVDHGE